MSIGKPIRRVFFAAVIAVVLFGVWKLFVSRDPVHVDVWLVQRGDVEELVTNSRAGSVRTRLRAQVGAATTGCVVDILHREGAEVDSHAVLLRLDDDVARAHVVLAERELQSARAKLLAAESEAELASTELARTRGLQERGAYTEEALDVARTRDRSARASADAAVAQVESARAALRLTKAELQHYTVRAPFAGVVNQLFVEMGASVIPGQPLLELMNAADLYVRAPMDELDIARIRVGQPARITLDPYRDRSFEAVVTRVAPFVSEFQEQNRTLDVEFEMRSVPPGVELHPGTSADVEIVIERAENTLRIPAIALLEGERVLVVHDGHAAERHVRVGLRNWDYVEILEGLHENEAVITSLDRANLQPGTEVVVQAQPAS
jgi:HlyD family secretion protein